MAAMSDYLEARLASHIFGTGTYVKTPAIAVALCSGDPADARTGATIPELPNVGAYARQAVTQTANNWTDPVAADGIVYNLVAITFPVAQSEWGWVSGCAIVDSATYAAGNMICHAPLNVPKNIGSGDQLIFNISGQSWTFA